MKNMRHFVPVAFTIILGFTTAKSDVNFVSSVTWLAQKASNAAYLPADNYLKDGKIIENWSASQSSPAGKCGRLQLDGALCYPHCNDGYTGRGPVCWEQCPANYVDDGATCRRDQGFNKKTYDRGAGRIPGCGDNAEMNGLLCYPKCRSGYYGNGPVCWERCPSGYSDMGLTCHRWWPPHSFGKGSYGRGAGWSPSSCSGSDEKHAGMCYTRCKSGYVGKVTVCYQNCPSGFTDTGLRCENLHVRSRGSYGRGAGTTKGTAHYESKYDAPGCASNGWTGEHHENDQEYIVLRNNRLKLSVFAFRGIDFHKMQELMAQTTSIGAGTLFGKQFRVEGHALQGFQDIFADVRVKLEATPKDHQIVLTGHSLGGAIATIAAPHFVEWGRLPDAVITFNSPRVGDQAFVDVYKANVGCKRTFRIRTNEDPVADSPKTYDHVCGAFTTKSGKEAVYAHDLYLGCEQVIEHFFGEQSTDTSSMCPKNA